MLEKDKKWDTLIRASKLERAEVIDIGQLKGYMGLYTVGLEHMYDYLRKNNELRNHGYWFLLDDCSNEGVYCSVCRKKVYKTDYANQKIKSKYCPNCGSIMDEEFEVL